MIRLHTCFDKEFFKHKNFEIIEHEKYSPYVMENKRK
jgi:hypothetical protein